jgi:flagellar hook-associated protein 2
MFGAFGTASVSGVISGINWDQFVQKLIELERQPITRLRSRVAGLENQKKLIGEFRAKLSELKLALSNLALRSVVLARTASTGSAAVGVTAGPDAVPGTFQVTVQQLATATVVSSAQALGQPVNPSVPLSQAGLGTAVTAGTFSINGVAISVDPAVDTLNDVINRINLSGAGVAASLVNDAYGRPNILRLESASPIQLGSGADTSNFLSATRLINGVQQNVGGTYRIDSAGNLGVVNLSAPVGSAAARLATPITSGGSFSINGVTITYTLSDSLSAIIARINSSAAGATAAYDPLQDRLVLTAKTTGNTRISLQDISGNFLSAAGLLSAPQALGQNAVFTVSTVNNGQPLSSPTNTVAGLLPGITLELKDVTASPVTVTVAQDTGPGLNAAKDFVSKLNAVLDFVAQQTNYDPNTKTAGPLLGDSTVTMIAARLRAALSGVLVPGGPYRTLADIGIDTGPVGSAPGTAAGYRVDEAKFTQALQSNPDAVFAVLKAAADRVGGYLDSVLGFGGLFSIHQSAFDDRIKSLNDYISALEASLSRREEYLRRQFTAMETLLAQLQVQSGQLGAQILQSMSRQTTQTTGG